MGIEEHKALVTEFYRRMNDREYEQMWDDLFTPDAVWGAGRFSTEAFGGIEKMKPLLVDPMPAFEDGGMHFTVHALTAEGDRVAAEVESYAPTAYGTLYNNHYHMLFEFRDGRIAVVKEYGDTAHARDIFGTLEL